MKIVELPSNVGGHRYRHDKFLIWISEKYGVCTARLWCQVTGTNGTTRFYNERAAIQETFKHLYELYCKDAGIDTSDIIYDNPDRDTGVCYQGRQGIHTWEVIEDAVAEGVKVSTSCTSTSDASISNKSTILSADELIKQFEQEQASEL